MARALPPPQPAPGRQSLVKVFLLSFLAFAYFMPRWADWNIDSRFDLTRAIVDFHTLRIDRFHQNTWDKAVYRGHYYSDKAPGTAVLGAAVYAAYTAARQAPLLGQGIRSLEANSAWSVPIALGRTATQAAPAAPGRVLGGCQRPGIRGNVQFIPWGNRLVPPMRDWALSKYVVTIGVNGLLSALFAAFFFWFLGYFTRRALYRWLLTGLYAFATTAFAYSTVFYSHQLAAVFLFTAFALLYLRRRAAVGPAATPVAGFLLGLAFFTEYTVIPIVAAVSLYGAWVLRRRLREGALGAIAGGIPLLALFAYNDACFGSPLDTGYSHDFCWSSAQAAGFAGFTYPHLNALLSLTVEPFRGLFYLSPFLLLAIPGSLLMFGLGHRLEALLCVLIGVGFLLMIGAYWGWNGGQVDGPRYLVPAIPFIALPVIAYLDRLERYPSGWILLIGTGIWSVFAVWVEFLGGLLFPASWLPDPIFQYSLPALSANQIAPNAGLFLGLSGWQSLLPLCLLLLVVGLWPARSKPMPHPVLDPVQGG